MGFGIVIRVQGDYALFTRPEMKVERMSYEVITPSAARGIIESVYWKPAIRWVIDRIHVLNAIRFINIRRNEVSEKIPASKVMNAVNGSEKELFLDTSKRMVRQQRASMILKDVDYVIEAHFELCPGRSGNEGVAAKHYNMALRRFRKGQYFRSPCLGTREFGARVDLIEGGNIPKSKLTGIKELGWMLYDLDFSNSNNIVPQFFNAVMIDGVIDLTQVKVGG